MREQELLDLARVNVLAAADDHVLDPPGDAVIAVGLPQGQVARVQPTVGVDRRGRGFGIVVVAEHHDVAAGAKLALLVVAQRRGQSPDRPS